MYGFILILTIAVLGGLLALLGDRVGMRMGKRKLSLFGLRPKHTSMMITVLTGLAISGLTLVLMAVVSEDVRTALFRMRQIRQELAVLKTEYQESMARLEEVLGEQKKTENCWPQRKLPTGKPLPPLSGPEKSCRRTRRTGLQPEAPHALEEVIRAWRRQGRFGSGEGTAQKEVQVLAAEASTSVTTWRSPKPGV